MTNMKDALMNCWQSSVSSLIQYMMAVKTSTHCYTEVLPRLMVSLKIRKRKDISEELDEDVIFQIVSCSCNFLYYFTLYIPAYLDFLT